MKLPILIFFTLWRLSDAYRILGVFPRNSPGHFMVFEQLMKSLADRGHHVDVVSPFPQATIYTNYYDVVELPHSAPSLTNNLTYYQITSQVHSALDLIETEHGNDVCHVLGDSNLQKILKNPPKKHPYDVVITEVFIANCFIAIGDVLNVPVVGVSTYGRLPWIYDMMSNPNGFDLVPGVSGSNHISFWHRLTKMLSTYYQKTSFYSSTKPQNVILKKYFGKKARDVRELESKLALVITNAHTTTHGARATIPALVEVGGMHIVEKNIPPLYFDIKEWIDKSTNGVVYFNLGTAFILESLPEEKINALYKSLKKLAPMKVLMRQSKFKDLPPGLPDNVLVAPHVQQLRVLQHPNVKAFVTHGGLLGIQEAIYTSVPVVGIPLWDDQFDNVELCVKKGLGVKVEIQHLTEKTLDSAFHQVLNNSTFKKAAVEYSNLVIDRPAAPNEIACYWVEYIARHGSKILTTTEDVTWWQLNNIDIYVTLSLLLLIVVVTIILIIRKVIVKIVSKFSRKITQKSQKLL